MFFRVTRTGPYAYLQVAESYRDRGRVRQRVLSTLGRLDLLQTSGQLDRLMRSGVRFCRQLAIIDAHATGQTEATVVRRIGPELVFGRLWEETGIAAVLQAELRGRHYEFDVERAVFLTVLHRLMVSGSDRAAHWRRARARGSWRSRGTSCWRAGRRCGSSWAGTNRATGRAFTTRWR